MTSASQLSNSLGSTATTRGICVRVEPSYDARQSVPEERKYLFRYLIIIENGSDATVRLVSRSWLIIDAAGEEHRVEGDGVVGLQPTLKPGERFEYQSFCPLRERWGTMEGHFLMEGAGGGFKVQVGRFYLVASSGRVEQGGQG